MRYLSTRDAAPAIGIDAALAAGLAPDGGLYVPARVPVLPARVIARLAKATLAEAAALVLAPYFAQSHLQARLPALCAEAFDFPAPLRPLRGDGDWMLELFHGPTAAFKDYAARFLALALQALRAGGHSGAGAGTVVVDAAPMTILVATSGDTGAAVAAAFHRRPGFRVVILYPDGRVSPRQAHGLECWGDNVRCLRVAGSFDDCQLLARQALGDPGLRSRIALATANSISLGRLLPQVAYYAHAAARFAALHGSRLNLVVPTGNLGNASAAWLARRMGMPIGGIMLATNANDVLPRYFSGGDYTAQPARATLANAMDVGAPGNFERLRYWHPDDRALRGAMRAASVDDARIVATIRTAPDWHGVIPCPHTATGLHVLEALRASGDRRPWAVVATAHPAKFDSIVEPLVGARIDVPPAMAAMLARPAHAESLPPDAQALRARLLGDGAIASG